MKSFISLHIFRHLIDDVKKKTSIPLDQVIKKVVIPFSGLSPPNSQQTSPKSSSSLPMKSFFISIHCILLRSPRTS